MALKASILDSIGAAIWSNAENLCVWRKSPGDASGELASMLETDILRGTITIQLANGNVELVRGRDVFGVSYYNILQPKHIVPSTPSVPDDKSRK